MATIRRMIGPGSSWTGISVWSSSIAYSIDDGNIEIGVIHEDGLDIAAGNNAYIGGTNTSATAYKVLTSGLYDTLYSISGSGTGTFNVTVNGVTQQVSLNISNPGNAVTAFLQHPQLFAGDVAAAWAGVTQTTAAGIIVDFCGAQTGKDVIVTQNGGGFTAAKLVTGGGRVANPVTWEGAKIRKRPRQTTPSGNDIGMLYVDAPYTRLDKVNLHVVLDDESQQHAFVTQYGVVVSALAHDTVVDGCEVVWPYGTFTDTAAFAVFGPSGGVHASLFNCVAIGGFDQPNNADRGFYTGFLVFGHHALHNCLVIGARGLGYDFQGATLTSGHKNSMAFKCGLGGWSFPPGSWPNVDRLMSDGAINLTGVTTPLGTEFFPSVDPATVLHDVDAYDFRLVPTSLAVDSGASAAGIFQTDIFGTQRIGSWDIGPIEGYAFPPIDEPSVESVTVAGQTQLNDWLKSTQLNLAALNKICEARLKNGAAYVLPAAITGSCGDSERYRVLRADVDEQYDPLVDYGARVSYVKTAISVAVFSSGFRFSELRIDDDMIVAAPAGTCYGIRLYGRDTLVDRCYVYHGGAVSGGDEFEQVTLDSHTARITNSIVKSGINPAGILTGVHAIWDFAVCGNNVLVDQTYGFRGPGICANNVAFGQRSFCYYQVSAAKMLNNIASDDSAIGLIAFNNVPGATVFFSISGEDYRLKAKSPAVNVGKDMGTYYTTDFVGATRRFPWDCGPYDGIPTGPETASVDLGNRMRLACLYNVERPDGGTLYLSDVPSAIPFRGQIYYPSTSARASARRNGFALEEASFQLEGGLSSARISVEDIIAKRYDDALVTEFIIDWKYPFAKPYKVRQWSIKELEYDEGAWKATLIGVTARFASRKARFLNRQCDANLGDENCRADLGPFTHECTVSDVSVSEPRRRFQIQSLEIKETFYFTLGELTWTSGDNVGLVCDIKQDQPISGGREMTVQLKTPYDVQVGDTFTAVAGCNKLYATCKIKFNNRVNYYGMPFLQRTDKLWDTPTSW